MAVNVGFELEPVENVAELATKILPEFPYIKFESHTVSENAEARIVPIGCQFGRK